MQASGCFQSHKSTDKAISFHGQADPAPTVAMTKFAYSTYVTPSAGVTLKEIRHCCETE